MRLHLSSAQPWCWAANWADSDGPTDGGCELVDSRGHQDTAHRAIYAIAQALVDHSDDCGFVPATVTLCLSPEQRRFIGDFQRRLQHGPWGSVHATSLAAVLARKGIAVEIVAATRRERAWMEEAAGKVAVESLGLGMGGVASRVVTQRNLGGS